MSTLGAIRSDASRPAFLDLLDRDPETAFRQFYDYTWRLLSVRPPRRLRGLAAGSREDVISEAIVRCWSNGQLELRRFRESGLPFALCLAHLAERIARAQSRAAGRLRARQAFDPDLRRLAEIPCHPDYDRLEAMALREIVLACFAALSAHCRLLLAGTADRYTRLHLHTLFGAPPRWRARYDTQLHRCRAELRRRLASRGVEVGRARSSRRTEEA